MQNCVMIDLSAFLTSSSNIVELVNQKYSLTGSIVATDRVFLCLDKDFRLVTPIETVSADPGSDVILPVHLSPETSAVSMTSGGLDQRN